MFPQDPEKKKKILLTIISLEDRVRFHDLDPKKKKKNKICQVFSNSYIPLLLFVKLSKTNYHNYYSSYYYGVDEPRSVTVRLSHILEKEKKKIIFFLVSAHTYKQFSLTLSSSLMSGYNLPRPKTAVPQRRSWRAVTSLKPVTPLPTSPQISQPGATTDFNLKTHLTDQEYEAALAQQQSAYAGPSIGPQRTGTPGNGDNSSSGNNSQNHSRRNSPASGADAPSLSAVPAATVKRSGGGRTWEDTSLLEWDPTHFRLFVGNLSGEVTDEMLARAFQAFPSVSKVKVVRNNKTQLTRGYGFVAFRDPEDYFKAFKQMNNKYIGNHPVQLRKATTDVKPTTTTTGGKKNHHGANSNEKKGSYIKKQKKPKVRSTPYDRLA
jgi:hypothetical protein